MHTRGKKVDPGSGERGQSDVAAAPGKRTAVQKRYGHAPVQRKETDRSAGTEHGHGLGALEDDDHLETGGSGPVGSIRFAADPELAAVAEGKKTLTAGASGIQVTKIQQALVEMGHLTADKVTGTLDKDTENAIKAFQKAAGKPESGTVDQATFQALDNTFKDYSVEGKVLAGIKPSVKPTPGKPYAVGKAPKELTDGTRTLSDAEKAAVNDALSTEQKADPKTGLLPTFTEEVGGTKYGDRLAVMVNKIIDSYLIRAKDMDKDRKAGHLYDWGDIDKVAAESKTATDAAFGGYATGPALTGTGVDAKIKDAWEHKEKSLAADKSLADGWADWRVSKILTGSKPVAAIDEKHGAIQSRGPEKAIVDKVKSDIASKRKDELVLIHKAWPAFASGGDVFVQRVQDVDDKGKLDKAKGRDYMWEMFQTVIHEYIHTLEHPAHVGYRKGIAEQKGGFTLREGVTDYFTKIAYNNTNRTDASLRKNVEGPFHEAAVTHTVPDLHTYGQSANAERAAGIAGLKNMCAAFFLGNVELIGKK